MTNHTESDFAVITINPLDIKAGDLILMGEKDANQLLAAADAETTEFGGHTFIVVPIVGGGSFHPSHAFDVTVRRNLAAKGI